MDKKLFLIYTIICMSLTSMFGQLPPVAQMLYDSAFAHAPLHGIYSIDSGAVAKATSDGNTFYLQWFPAGGPPNSHPLLVTLHGSAGTAFDEFFIWHNYAKAKGVGIIAIQWYRGYSIPSPSVYFDDIELYEYIDTALTRIQYPSNKAFFHGFSRGSEISYAIAFRDVQPPKGKNYFCTIMSNSGRVEPDSTLYSQINAGMYGHTFYNGKKWGMFCGGLSGYLSNCQAMDSSKLWVEANGGDVGLYIHDDTLGHGGFHQTPVYIDSALNYYLSCYLTTTISESGDFQNHPVKIYPNPFSTQTTLNTEMFFKDASLTVYNSLGQQVKQIKNISGQAITLFRDNLPSGLYFLRLTQNNKIFITKKLIITD